MLFHISGLENASEIIDALKKNNIPYGTANLSNPGGIGVTTDDYQGALDAVKYLAGLGHRKILFLSIPERNACSNEYSFNRRNGYLDGMKKYLPDVRPDILEVSNSELGSVAGIREKLREARPTAVFCLGDSFAMRVFQAADQEGIAIPEQLSVVGYGGLVMSEYASVPMTTVIQDFEKMGALTARQVIDRLEKKEIGDPEKNIRLPVKLLVRDSTRKVI
ncbi:Arabinose metabolism transcriptional repressor [bioreactor metagenome]|uniref:Arabinose metabolism transcriptional repressor n=1 Tax=bioreactor metagenome TaxID=1076179 RepID=A0A645FIW0_9ZZZZ